MVVIGRREPVLAAFSERDSASHPKLASLLDSHSVEGQHSSERRLHVAEEFELRAKLANDLCVQDRRFRVETASLGERKQPLNVVVSLFRLVVRPTMNLSKKAPAVVGPSADGFCLPLHTPRITC